MLEKEGITFVQQAITKKNYKALLKPLLTRGRPGVDCQPDC